MAPIALLHSPLALYEDPPHAVAGSPFEQTFVPPTLGNPAGLEAKHNNKKNEDQELPMRLMDDR